MCSRLLHYVREFQIFVSKLVIFFSITGTDKENSIKELWPYPYNAPSGSSLAFTPDARRAPSRRVFRKFFFHTFQI